jgi:hypothetical protein
MGEMDESHKRRIRWQILANQNVKIKLAMVDFIIQATDPDAVLDADVYVLERNNVTLWHLWCFLEETQGDLTHKLWIALMSFQDQENYEWDNYDRAKLHSILPGSHLTYGIDDDALWQVFNRKRYGEESHESESAEKKRLAGEERLKREQLATLRRSERPDEIRREMNESEQEGRKKPRGHASIDDRRAFPEWNKYAMQYCLDDSDDSMGPIEADKHCRREFCDGLTSAQLLAQVTKDRGMEFQTPEAYAEMQVERAPGITKVNVAFKYLPERKAPQPDGFFNRGSDADVSLGWACLASWYYDRHEGVVEKCWKAYDAFKRGHGGRTIDEDDNPFVRKKPYEDMQFESDVIELQLAPARYQEIRKGLNVVALFLGNRRGTGTRIMDRFRTAIGFPRTGHVPSNLKKCNRQDLPSYPARTAEERYFPVADFVKAIFKTAPNTGGPNWDSGINPAWTNAEFKAHEGDGASQRKLSLEESQQQRDFVKWLGERKGEMDYDLRMEAGLCLPEDGVSDAAWVGAKRILDALWDFLAVHAWPVYRRWKAKDGVAPFASIQAHHKRWFRDVHYDEYDRWAHRKWAKSGEEGEGQKAQAELPDLYTLMKRRHKLAIEADECREEMYAFEDFMSETRVGTYAQWRANGYANEYETVNGVQNVHRPSSGGRSYGAGAYTALKHDPYCTFGRQRGFSIPRKDFDVLRWRTPAEEPRTEWPTTEAGSECNYCADDASTLTFPPPRKPPPSKRKGPAKASPKPTVKPRTDVNGKGFFGASLWNARRLCRTRFRARMTEALLGHRLRMAKAPAI